MIPITYTLSPATRELLKKCDDIRDQVLLTGITPAAERSLRWETLLRRVSILVPGGTANTERVVRALSGRGKTQEDTIIGNFARVSGYISEHWTASPRTVMTAEIDSIDTMLRAGKAAFPPSRRIDPEDIRELLKWLQTKPDHPVVSAALAYGHLAALTGTAFHPLAMAVSSVFLYKDCYSLKDLLAVEPGLREHPRQYEAAVSPLVADGKSAPWIDYYTECSETALTVLLDKLQKPARPEAGFSLSARQQEILGLMANPDSRITNIQVKTRFRISQVTASRELAKLVKLGVLAGHGKGRSVYYTRI